MSKSVQKLLALAWRPHFGVSKPRLGDTTHVKVIGLSRTALPGDLRRLCIKNGLENIAAVNINYNGFMPTQEGYISFTRPSFVRNALKALNNAIVGGYSISAQPSHPPDQDRPQRTRGHRGRADAAERGVITGDGPGAGITRPGRNVYICGLPPKVTPHSLKLYLQDFQLADTSKSGEQEIMQIEGERQALTSKYLVRLATASDAHRLARQLHMTPYAKDSYGSKYRMKVRVIS